jgi:hypothetical protein
LKLTDYDKLSIEEKRTYVKSIYRAIQRKHYTIANDIYKDKCYSEINVILDSCEEVIIPFTIPKSTPKPYNGKLDVYSYAEACIDDITFAILEAVFLRFCTDETDGIIEELRDFRPNKKLNPHQLNLCQEIKMPNTLTQKCVMNTDDLPLDEWKSLEYTAADSKDFQKRIKEMNDGIMYNVWLTYNSVTKNKLLDVMADETSSKEDLLKVIIEYNKSLSTKKTAQYHLSKGLFYINLHVEKLHNELEKKNLHIKGLESKFAKLKEELYDVGPALSK